MEINYETKYISDSLNRNAYKYAQYTLLFNEKESYYFNRDAKKYYDILQGKRKNENINSISTSIGNIPKYPQSTSSVQKLDGKIFATLPIGKYMFTFEEPLLQWEILPETKQLKGFKCQLAKTVTDTNDTFFAWFTNDIPIAEGPFRFKNLSGIVLEVHNKNKTIEIYATDIKKSEEIIEKIGYFSLIETKSKKQFLEARKNFLENPSAYNGGLKIYDSNMKDISIQMVKNLQKINVFLD